MREQPLSAVLDDRPCGASSGAPFTAAATLLAGQAGLLFGWRPDDFWTATPVELAALVLAASGGGDGGGAVAARPVDLAALMERFPDE